MRREALIEARKKAGKSQEQVAEDVGCDRTSVSGWERGETTPHPRQRAAYAESLGVTLTELDYMLSSIPPPADRTAVWLSQYLSAEQSATELVVHEPHVVDGLLQTPEYARAIGRSVGVYGMSDDYADRNVEQRAWRRTRVLNGDMQLHVVQPEVPLHLQLGSPAAMAEQLDYLVEMGHRDNVTIQIVPYSVGQYEAFRMGAISIMTHPWVQGRSVYYRPYQGLAQIDDADHAANFLAAVESAMTLALSPDDSLAFIAQAADQWRHTDG